MIPRWNERYHTMSAVEESYRSARSVLKHFLAVLLALGIIALCVRASDALFIALLAPWLLVIPVVILVVVMRMDIEDHHATGGYRAFSGTGVILAGALCGAALIAVLRTNGNIPVVIRAGQFQDFNGSSLALRVDGTYRFCDIVFDESCCTGRYEMKGDTIVLRSRGGCREGVLIVTTCGADPSRTCLCWTTHLLPEMWVHEDHRTPP